MPATDPPTAAAEARPPGWLVAMATGVLAARLHCPPADAARQLAELAERVHLTVPELAADIVAELAPDTAAPAASAQVRPVPEPADDRAREGDPAAAAVLAGAAPMAGATGVILWTLGPGGSLVLVGSAGFRADDLAGWDRVPPDVDTAAQRVAREAAEFGPDGPDRPAPGLALAPYRMALPLQRRGRLTGVLELAWPERPDAPAPAGRRRLAALAEVAALALAEDPGPGEPAPAAQPPDVPRSGTGGPETATVDAVLDPALLLDPVLQPDGAVTDFRIRRVNRSFADPAGRPPHTLESRLLSEAYPMAAAEGLLDRLVHVHRAGRPLEPTELRLTFPVEGTPRATTVRLAAAPDGERLLLVWRLTEEDRRQAELLAQAQRLARVGGFEEDLRTGEIHWSPRLYELHLITPGSAPMPLGALPGHVHPDDRDAARRVVRSVLSRHREASAVLRLVHPTGPVRYVRVIAEPVTDATGRTVAVRGAYQDVSAQHRTEIALAATRERLADSEQEAAERHRLALRLQKAILPTGPPPLDRAGLRAAVRYRPAAREERVGGDWYDAVPLPGGRALLVIGDMAGHGVEAATGMVTLRNALRGLAATGAGPGRLLRWLNLTAAGLPDAATATVVCARYDRDGRRLRWARAGHLPPILLRGGRADPLPLPHGVLLGADPEQDYEEHTVPLDVGDILLLYTDGLVERRDRSVEDSLRDLADGLPRTGDDLDALLDTVLELSAADTEDDTCLIAVQVLA
ncbi:SpoIIE family protein phosphatase [Kitasatospora paracochleata]|uniref:Serine phosphatase RsbU (Regulator of sigma subunit) n=1 Tax=Kitasatospora paracochleata TaxID=58354 RepID=A0ABT1J3P5_9ACTN|nr:SpoIIE family protein phosphatase [Kitasatospora paracochleata]MCP2312047.1 serine phosphatase RsbU (regulator of sigma subunit) [Kitasatospora paracochleata]